MKENLVIPNHVGIIMDGNGRWADDEDFLGVLDIRREQKHLKRFVFMRKV